MPYTSCIMREYGINPEQSEAVSAEDIYYAINDLEPRPVLAFNPTDGEEQKRLFFDGSIRNPRKGIQDGHAYNARHR